MTENNSRVQQKKVMSKKSQGLWHRKGKEVVGLLLVGNEKSCYCQLFIKLSFVFKLSGLNDYLKGYLKSRINKLLKEINNK